jgi:hypothetical protein
MLCRRLRRGLLLPALALCLGAVTGRPARAQDVSVDLLFGTAYNAPTPLTIRQEGFPDLGHTAHYRTRPLGPYAPYYSARLSVWRGDRAWEVHVVHHRLFLHNTTPEIERFEVHFGYSYLMAGHAWRRGGFVIHAAGGAVITRPANRVRGRSFGTGDPDAPAGGYDLSGVGAAIGISRRARVARHLSVVGTAAFIAGRASVPVNGGSATVPNAGIHGQIGLGFDF